MWVNRCGLTIRKIALLLRTHMTLVSNGFSGIMQVLRRVFSKFYVLVYVFFGFGHWVWQM